MTTSVNETHIFSQFKCVRDSSFFPTHTNPTRYRDDNESSVLDLILTNEEEMVIDIKYLPWQYLPGSLLATDRSKAVVLV